MSALSPTTLSLGELESTFGALFVGFVVSIILYGFTFFQSYIYFSRYSNDSIWIKLTAGGLCALDTTTSALISQAVYYYLIDQFMSPVGLVDATATFCAENGLAILATFVVQVFYATRVFQVGGRSWLCLSVISGVAFVAFGFGVAMTVQIFKQKQLAALATPHMEIVAGMSQGLAALADILIVAGLTFSLQTSKNPRMRQPEGWFDKFVTYFVNRCVCVTVVQLAYMCVFVAMPSKQIWIPFHLVVSKLYVNTLLAMLNSRDILHGRGVNEEESAISTRKINPGLSSSSGGSHSGAPVRFNVSDSKVQSFNIEVSQTIDIEHDEADKVRYDADDNSSHHDTRKGNALAPEGV